MSDMDNLPDFDNMSPEEIQLWMESLAKRQGASEGLITAADMEIAELDPDSVVIDGPGYVPSESFTSSSSKKQEAAPPPPVEVKPAAAQVTPPSTSFEPPASTMTSGRGTGERVRLPTEPPPRTPIMQQPPPPIAPPQEVRDETLSTSVPSQPVEGGGLAWLESLAADQDDGFELDFASLTETAFPADEITQLSGNPESWLDDLVSSGGEIEEAIEVERPSARVSGAFIEDKPRWMDADDESEEIELPDLAAVDQDDPEGWLRTLSAAEGYDEDGVSAVRHVEEDVTETHETERVSSLGGIEVDDETLAEIKRAIAEGRVSSDQMQLLLDYQTDILVQQPDTQIDIDDFYDPDAPPEKAVIPDWLLESAGVPPNLEGEDSGGQSNEDLISLLETEPAQSNEMTDWLKSETSVDFQSIFADEPAFAEAGGDDEPLEFEIDEADSWGEAFELERNQDLGDLDNVPDWYEQNLNDPERIAAVEEIEVSRLNEADLPVEDQLQAAERVDVPEWLQDISEQQGEVVSDVPEWLLEAEQVTATDSISDDMPSWLMEVSENYDEPEPSVVTQEPVIVTQPVVQPPKQAPVTPKAPPVEVSADIKEALAQARELSEANDVPNGLGIYEALIRHSVLLDDVVSDLQSLKRKHRDNPAVYRVLGDGLMRQGNLQAALDTYRDALNHL